MRTRTLDIEAGRWKVVLVEFGDVPLAKFMRTRVRGNEEAVGAPASYSAYPAADNGLARLRSTTTLPFTAVFFFVEPGGRVLKASARRRRE